MLTHVRSAALDAFAVLFPVSCAGCGSADRALCSSCVAALTANTATKRNIAGIPVVSALEYRGVVRNALLAFKEQDRTDLARRFAPALLFAVQSAAEHAATVCGTDGAQISSLIRLCAIPSSRQAWQRRGYTPVEKLITSAGLRVGVRLRQSSAVTLAQKSLTQQNRWDNREGTFRSTGRLDGVRVVLVDDVITTGASIAEAVRAIRDAGGEVVSAATVAFTPLRWPVSNQPQGISA